MKLLEVLSIPRVLLLFKTMEKMFAMYARAMKRLSAVIGDQDPSLLSSVMRSRGTRAFYQVRIGADTRPAADDLCNRIRKAGGACFVLKNRVVPG